MVKRETFNQSRSDQKMEGRLFAPTALCAVGLGVMFMSGGDKMLLTSGDALVAISGLIFMKFLN